MGSQKPEEWANLLIARFEDQVNNKYNNKIKIYDLICNYLFKI